MDAVDLDAALRLLAATLAGMAIGLNRDLRGKPTGIRTLGLVALGSAIVTIAMAHYAPFDNHPDASSRVLQGVVQGVLTGIGFLGAGVIMRNPQGFDVHGLTTAAAVWVTAVIGIVCGLGDWSLVVVGGALTLFLLVCGGPIERFLHRRLGATTPLRDE